MSLGSIRAPSTCTPLSRQLPRRKSVFCSRTSHGLWESLNVQSDKNNCDMSPAPFVSNGPPTALLEPETGTEHANMAKMYTLLIRQRCTFCYSCTFCQGRPLLLLQLYILPRASLGSIFSSGHER